MLRAQVEIETVTGVLFVIVFTKIGTGENNLNTGD